MKRHGLRNILAILFVLVMVMMSMSVTAFAADESNQVGNINVRINGNKSTAHYPDVFIDNSHVHAVSFDWSMSEKDYKNASDNDVLKLTIELRPASGYYFGNKTYATCEDDYTAFSFDIDSRTEAELRVEIKVSKVRNGSNNSSPSGGIPLVRNLDRVKINSYGNTYITWDAVSHADEYNIKVYSAVDGAFLYEDWTTNTKYRLSTIRDNISTTYRDTKVYLEIVATTDDDYFLNSGITKTDNFWVVKNDHHGYYQYYEGNGWIDKGNGNWMFMENWKIVHGWMKIEGSWYYFNSDGYMRMGWLYDGNDWYYFAANGKMCHSEWVKIGNYYYYFYEDGAMAVDTWIGSFHVNEDGAWDRSR